VLTIEEFSHLVALIYAAATAPEQWESVIRAIQSSLDGTAGSLLRVGAVLSFHESSLPVESLQSYEQYYSRLDYALAAVQLGPVGAVRTGAEVLVPNRNEEFYADWMRPNQLEDGCSSDCPTDHDRRTSSFAPPTGPDPSVTPIG
jgi:hypothetical protein